MASKKIRSGAYRTPRGFACATSSGRRVVPAGALVPHEFPYEVMDGREHLFVDITAPRGAAPVVEQATAAPGETRRVKRPSKSDG